MLVIANLFPKLQTVKILVKGLFKNRCFRKRFDSQHVKYSQILAETSTREILSCFSIILKKVDFKNFSPRARLNLSDVCWQIERRSQVCRSILPEFATANSNAIIWKTFHHAFSSFWGKLICKMSALVLSEILGVFADILTSDCKYPVQYIHNLWLPIQMQLFEKRKTSSRFFVPFIHST